MDSRKTGVLRKGSLAIMIPLSAFALTTAALAESEEQHLARIAQKLKPISDTQWNEIAGSKTGETYDVVKGDTLWDVSKRLFGNSFYWPKVWSLNNATGLTNPHAISPGQKLAFLPGSSESTPKLSTASETPSVSTPETPASSKAAATPAKPSGPHEYDRIPKDWWSPEQAEARIKERYDEYGIDKELKINLVRRFSFRVPAIANDTTVPFLGEVVGSRRDGVGLAQGETVFLKSNSQDLQVGTTYSVLGEPEFVRERKSDRAGYIYHGQGEIKIVGVKDELYVGVITRSYDVITRGSRLYPLLPVINDIKPLPARSALEALVVTSTIKSTRNSAQFRFVHLDRGIEDGVQVGNVFRIYDYYDPVSKAKLTDSDFLINADAIVVHATAQFSTALVLRSRETFARGDFGVLLTDVSDLERKVTDRIRGFGEGEPGAAEDKELDELDELDRTSGEGLGRKEETEIKELDQWDKTKDLQTPSADEPTVPSAADTPTDEAEKLPGAEPESQPAEPTAPLEPTLDQNLDSPAISPPGIEPPPPPADLKQLPEQTLEAPPPPPVTEEPAVPGDAIPNEPMPEAEPMAPEAPPTVEPAQPTPPDDLESKTQ